jgi:hypothetical protein
LVEVIVELQQLNNGGVGFLELFAVAIDKDGLDVVDELVNPREVKQ